MPLKLKYRLGSFWKPQLIMSREGRLQCMAGGNDASKSGNMDIMNSRQTDRQPQIGNKGETTCEFRIAMETNLWANLRGTF